MRCGAAWCALLVLVTAATVVASPPQASGAPSDQEVLIGLERRWNEAVYSKDIAFIDSILADDFAGTDETGDTGDRAKELQLVADFNQQVESATQDEFVVRVYRDTAVVRFTLHLVGIRQGQRAEVNLRSPMVRDAPIRWRECPLLTMRVLGARGGRGFA